MFDFAFRRMRAFLRLGATQRMPRWRHRLSYHIEEGSRLRLFRRFFAVLFHSHFHARRILIRRRDARPARADVSIRRLEPFTYGYRMFDEIVACGRGNNSRSFDASLDGTEGAALRREKNFEGELLLVQSPVSSSANFWLSREERRESGSGRRV